jgi:tRNA(Ile2) C34 agmatinyltransferase TiaS
METEIKHDAESVAAVGCSAFLGRRICPGCGTESPKSKSHKYFRCEKCEWESEDGLPTLRAIMRGKFTNCNDVNLTRYLRTLMRPNVEPSERR